MAVTLAQLFTPLAREDVESSILAVASTLGLPVTSWAPLGVARTIIASVSQKVADLSEIMVAAIKGGFLDYAEKAWLDLLAQSVYGVTRVPAVYATGTITLTNSSATVYAFAAGELHVANTATGKTYTNSTSSGTLAGHGALTLTVAADVAGSASTSGPAAITTMVTPLIGVTVSNAGSLVGADAESDPLLVQRSRDKLGALSPDGPRAAYAFFAKTQGDGKTPLGTSVPITRVFVSPNPATGAVTIYVANATGVVSDPDVAIVDTNIQAWAVPLAVTATTASAIAHDIVVAGDVYIGSTAMTDGQVQAAIGARLSAYFSTIPIGGYTGGVPNQVFLDALIGQVFQSTPALQQVTLSAPVTDATLATNEVATLTSSTFAVHHV